MHLSKKKTRDTKIFAFIITAIIGSIFLMFIWRFKGSHFNIFAILLAVDILTCYNIYRIFTKKLRDREALLKVAFPENWRKILEKYVHFYRVLSKEDKDRFETEIQIFLHETRITGIKTEVDDLTMVLAAASAEILVFSFPEWEYENLGEILIYPGAFAKDFRTEGPDRNVLGMVGTGIMQGIMILSKPALIAGFENIQDKKNVGIHEFAHLLDAADGSYDGIPTLFLENRYIEPWLDAMHKELDRIYSGDSKMNPYGGTNKVEFFAVATEYFFEHPKSMQKNKPELYEMMTRIFQQDTRNHFTNIAKSLLNYTGNKIGRNAPCPCGSGKKYKSCCLNNARTY